jgi:hypothetical protein
LIKTSLTLLQKAKAEKGADDDSDSDNGNTNKTASKKTQSSVVESTILVENLNDKIVKYCRDKLQEFGKITNQFTLVSIITNGDEIVDINTSDPAKSKGVLSKMDFECIFEESIPPSPSPSPIIQKENTQLYSAIFKQGKIVKFDPI